MTKLSNARAIVEASSAVFGASLLIQLLQNTQLNDTALGQLDEAATTEAALGAAKAFVAELERTSRAAGANANGEKGGEPADAVVVARDGEQTGFAAAIAPSKAAEQNGEKERKIDELVSLRRKSIPSRRTRPPSSRRARSTRSSAMRRCASSAV